MQRAAVAQDMVCVRMKGQPAHCITNRDERFDEAASPTGECAGERRAVIHPDPRKPDPATGSLSTVLHISHADTARIDNVCVAAPVLRSVFHAVTGMW
jgi:hypothetical protein